MSDFDFQSPDDYFNDPVENSYSGDDLADNPSGGFTMPDIFTDWAGAFDALSFDFVADWGEAINGGINGPQIRRTGAAASPTPPGFGAFIRSKLGIVTLGLVAALIVWRLVKSK